LIRKVVLLRADCAATGGGHDMQGDTPGAEAIVSAIAEMVADPILDRLSDRLQREPGRATTRLLTRQQLAEQLQCSLSKIDQLVREGMPGIRVGDVWRFELAEVLAWCRARHAAAPDTDTHEEAAA
jgi:excisionase family DNA binding protein